MSVYNRAYSAPRGYDLRAPYNVPMGEIQKLEVVRPFSIRSLQRNTIVEGFKGSKVSWMKSEMRNFGPPGPGSHEYIQVIQKEPACCGKFCFAYVSGVKPPCAYRDAQMEKLFIKGLPRVK